MKNKPLLHIGKMIIDLREGQNMTQTDLAEKIGSTQSVIARIEKGEQNLSTETLAKLSKALNHEIVAMAPKGKVNFRIEGGHKLSGKIEVRSSKNGAVGIMTASLLNKGITIIRNAPKIEEVYRISEVLESIGVRVEWKDNDLIITPPKKIAIEKINKEIAGRTRAAMMIMGPLIHEFKSFNIPQTGGCRLGTRTIKPYFYALKNLGVKIETTSNYYKITNKGLYANDIVLYEAGDTVSETILMAVARIPEKTVIKFASANYQVQDVCFYLEKLGVKIEGIGTTTLTVHGVENIDINVEYTIGEDPIEAMSLLTTAIVTNSGITIERCPIDFLELELLKLEKMGFKYEIKKKYKGDNGKVNLVDIKTLPSQLTALEEKIHAQPYPGLNMDNLPFFAVIGAIAKGQTFIHDWTFEERAIYYKELDNLGTESILADPHRFYIKGPTKLKAAEIVCPPALRPSVIIMIAMMAAEGTSILRNVYNINRGYEDLAERLNSIGARIETFRDL
ncbi:MAG: UDP-N-acetylglucosamine 1-carboxyvinyltransferase [Candidatus Taylorbacteria bacterium]|nr:UDP-N-acetylglucosamine 1-carboxyvinyltransferase [Candidatus Taylorbacteria bacterium]